MRIAISVPRRSWGGAASVIAALAPALVRRGHDVTLLCRPGSPIAAALAGAVRVEPVLRWLDFPIPAAVRSARVLRRQGVQAVLSVTTKDLRFSVPAGFLARVPVVVSRVALFPMERSFPERFLWGSVAHFIANSAATREVLLASGRRIGPEEVSVIHNAVDAAACARAEPADLGPRTGFRAGFVGRFEPEKGLVELAAAWPTVAGALPGAELVMAGEGAEEAALRSALAAEPGVRWLGFRHDVPAVLKALDALVLPSRSEAFGMVAAEALAAGVPVVASRVGGIPEVVRDGVDGILVPPRDPAALAAALIALARDPVARRRMGESGAARIAMEFSIDAMADGYEAVLADVIARPEVAGRRPVGTGVGRDW